VLTIARAADSERVLSMAEQANLSAGEIEKEHQAEAHAPYLRVWAALAVFTLIEYFYAFLFKDAFAILLLGLLFWAVIKAGLVGWYFMHLKFEGSWVYILIVPAFILAAILVMACMPDMVLKPVSEDVEGEEASVVAPVPLDARIRVSEARIRESRCAQVFPDFGLVVSASRT
jgi:cytochrome c oxidase subunit IV